MLSPRCRAFRSFGRPSLWRTALFALLLVWFASSPGPSGGVAAYGQLPQPKMPEPVYQDNVEQFRVFLRDDVTQLGDRLNLVKKVTQARQDALKNDEKNEKKLAFYTNLEEKLLDEVGREGKGGQKGTPGTLTKKVNERFDELEPRLVHLAELGAVLRLVEWVGKKPDDNTVFGIARANEVLPEGSPRKRMTGMRETIDARFLEKARGAAAAGDRRQKIALCVLLGEEANRARKIKSSVSNHYRRLLTETVPLVVEFSKSPGAEDRPLREAAVTALSLLDAQPKQLIEAVKKLRTEDGKADVGSRRIAFAALRRPYQLVSPRSDPFYQGTTVRTQPLKEQDRYEQEPRVLVESLGPDAVGELAAGLDPRGEPDPEIRRTCVEALKDLTAILLVDPYRLPILSPKVLKEPPNYENLVDAYQSITNLIPLFEAIKANKKALADAARDPDPGIRLEALSVLRDLAQIHNRLAAWQAQLRSYTKDEPGKAQALRPETKPIDLTEPLADPLKDVLAGAVEVLAAGLKNPDPEVRVAALDVLEELGPGAKPAAPALIQALSDKDTFVRWGAVRVLGQFAPGNAKEVVPALVPLVGTPDSDVARALAGLLSKYGADAAPAVPALTKAILAGEPPARIAYLQALSSVGAAGADAIPTIRQLLRPDPKGGRLVPSRYPPAFAPSGPPKYDDGGVRAAAAEALGRFGKLAASAEPELREALNDDDANVRRAAGDALLRIRGK